MLEGREVAANQGVGVATEALKRGDALRRRRFRKSEAKQSHLKD
jgi:hypothetical protein